MSETCRSCQAPVIWVRTEAGKAMPVDAEPVPNGNLLLVAEQGKVIAYVREPDMLNTSRYVSHFVTCGQADVWRRPPAQHHSAESVNAATQIAPKVTGLQQKVLTALKRLGPLTDEEIATALNMNPSTARPRRIELAAAGLVVRDGTGSTKSGRPAARWALNQQRTA